MDQRTPFRATPGREGAGAADAGAAREAVEWAVSHLSEREAVFARADLLAGALAWDPGAVSMAEAEREVAEDGEGGSTARGGLARSEGRAHHGQGRRI